jgi:TonB-linked SusC/RagA family outer membrane protein
MNKISNQHALQQDSFHKKLSRIMRLTIACLLIACLHVAATGHTQDKVTLNLKSAELRKAIIAIEKKTDYRFLFNEELLSHRPKIDINVVEAPVIQVLDQLLQNTGISYKVLNNKLVVLKETSDIASLEDLQDIRVSGRVTTAAGDGLAGVSITVKGTRTGTTTDAGGNFAITVPDNAVLIFSYVGYESKEVTVAGQTSINVQLTESVRIQEQVVVIGYGTASKRDLTGSITKVSGKEVADKPNTNPVASLQGKVAGLSVVNNGTPGQAPDIRIRGTVSIGQVHPLYVVDGIFEDNIDYINPNDIESIEILKDPSSLAIFGVKGATGVIAITTKRARVGQVVINFNTSFGFKKLVDKIKMANAAEFDKLFAEENANNGVATPDYSALTSNTDWIDAVTRTGKFNTDNISISQSTDKNRFTLGLGYIYDEGIIKHEKLEKMLLSFNDEVKVTRGIKIGVNLNASRQHNPYDATWVLDAARKVMPQISAGTKPFRVQNPYGTDTITMNLYSGLDLALQNSGVINPLLELENKWDKTISIEYRTVGSVYADINFLKYFNFRSTFYADISEVNGRTYSPLYYAYDPLTNTPYLYNQTTQVSETDNTWRKFQQDHILTFKSSFGDHNVTATAGFTTYYFSNFERTGVAKPYTTGNALPIPDDKRFWYVTNGFEDPAKTIASSFQGEYSTVSVLGRILYNYKGKYYLNASLRDDASSQIPTKNRHQQFWAVGAAWELTKENFMQGLDMIDFLKLKGSIGVLGNQTIPNLGNGRPNYYPFYPNLSTGTGAVFGTNVYNAAVEAYRVNPDLRWETVHAGEIGVELNAFKNRLHFEANYFDKTTKDLMTYISLGSLGLKDQLENGGSLRNWGEEFSAMWNQNFNKDLTLNVSGNITFLKNKVLTLSPDLPGGYIGRGFANNNSAEARTLVGQPIGSFYGYIVEGIYQSYAEILASPVASSIGAYRPGDLKFKDINGPNGKGPDGKITADDRTVIGNPTPKFTYGGSINLTYKGITLGIDVGGVYGNQVFRVWGSLESPFQRVNYAAYQVGAWTGAGTSNWVPLVSQADRFNYNGSTYNIEDGSYFRIRNIQLGYNFGRNMISKWKVSNLRLFANVQNLKTWKNNLGYTAEFGGDATGFGFDFAGGAIPIVTTFGLNVTF